MRGARSSSPPVASTDRAKPYSRASHGSATSSTITASASTGGPRSGMPRAMAASTRNDMSAARCTLGWGVTTTTNSSSTVAEVSTRPSRGMPSAPPPSMTRPTTIAQFAPETAVRWVRLLVFIAASSRSDTAPSSPIARPGSRSPPSPARPAASSANACRSSSAHATTGACAPTTSSPSLTKTRKRTRSPAGVASRVPCTATSSPIRGDEAPCSANTSTGEPAIVASTGSPVPVTSATRSTSRANSAAATSSAGARTCGLDRDRRATARRGSQGQRDDRGGPPLQRDHDRDASRGPERDRDPPVGHADDDRPQPTHATAAGMSNRRSFTPSRDP